MALRRAVAVVAALTVVVSSVPVEAAQYRTQNFVVEAPTYPIAQQVGQYAEYYRQQKAREWLGQEMPPWPEPCPLRVTLSPNGSGGATSFAYDRGRILSIDMNIEGSLDRLLASVLPHEVTHTVFAHFYRCPSPRWADEGGSVLSEDDLERQRHDHLVRQILRTPGRAIPLRRLFTMTKYPNDVMVLYAEGYSVTNFLVNRSNRMAFLRFVAAGMRGDWDAAVRDHYGFRNVEELERAWVQDLWSNPQGAPTQLASNRGPDDPSQRFTVRTTAPPVQPFNNGTTVRAQAEFDDGRRPSVGQLPDSRSPTASLPVSQTFQPAPQRRLGPPQFEPTATPTPGGWSQPPQQQTFQPAPQVRLGPPQFEPGGSR
jgi:hypothetical protein